MLLENRGVVDHCAAAQPYDHVQKKIGRRDCQMSIVWAASYGGAAGLAPSRSTE